MSDRVNITLDIELPKVKFHEGDVVKVLNTNNKYCRYVLISRILYHGNFTFCSVCEKVFSTINEVLYECAIQPGSVVNVSGEKIYIRPGLRKVFKSSDLDRYESVNFDKSKIVKPDTPENIRTREKEWRTILGKLKETGKL